MNQSGAATLDVMPEEAIRAREQTAEHKPKKLPPHAVVLFNDEKHSFFYVTETLMKVFGYSQEKSFQLTVQVHNAGQGIVWSGPKEVAELKCEQIRSAGPDFYAQTQVDFPLRVTVEPLPG